METTICWNNVIELFFAFVNEIQILLIYKATWLRNLPERNNLAQRTRFDASKVSNFVNNFYFSFISLFTVRKCQLM